jgi:hypothetical protein
VNRAGGRSGSLRNIGRIEQWNVGSGARLWENAWDEVADALYFPQDSWCRVDRLTRAA